MKKLCMIICAGAVLSLSGLAAAGTPMEVSYSDLHDAHLENMEYERERAGTERDVAEGQRSGIDSGVGWLGLGVELVNSASELNDAYSHLNEVDGQFEPDYSPSGMPQVPSSCLEEGREACAECFSKAYHELDFLRRTLERLRAIYGAAKTYADRAMSFGDSASGIHGVSGLAWQYEKRDIQKSVDKLGNTYDKKYRELIGNLQKTLRAISACESEHFDERDWYDRFGFIYFSFMEDRYRRGG